MWRSLAFLALLASAQGRAVNISNTWVLPEEGFPVFYRYFRDRISWYEADAVCQFHHANLVTVDTTAQYDAVRAYLKELDISSAVWVGLIRSNPDGDFTWTDYRGLSGDGYWSSAPDTRSAPLCAAANPAADYRWEARACGGPTVASFICELPVPQWALGNDGCMVRELPALTILYLPESAAVQLNADCGLAGVKRVQCTGNVKREGLLKDLSCADEEEIFSTSISTNWPATTDSTVDQDIASDVTTDENTTTEREVEHNQPLVITATLLPQYINSKSQYKYPTKHTELDDVNNVLLNKDITRARNDDHNIQSNFIPRLVDEGNILTNEQLEKLEDERHMQHKMLHEEVARVGNVDNIFTQPTDHFIPPLVMAKSRMSDDMTVLSLAEKHAQQLAEKQFSKHVQSDYSDVESNNNKLSLDNTHITNKPLITSIKPNKEYKQINLKSHLPKKYNNEKYYESKAKTAKMWRPSKTTATDKLTNTTQTSAQENSKTNNSSNQSHQQDKKDEDFAMDLTVLLKDDPLNKGENTASSNYADDVAKLDIITNNKIPKTNKFNNSEASQENTPLPNINIVDKNTMEHHVVQITIISNEDPTVNSSVFEITTKMPIFRDDTTKLDEYTSSFSTLAPTTTTHITEIVKQKKSETTPEASVTNTIPVFVSSTTGAEDPITINDTTVYVSTLTETFTTKTDVLTTLTPLLNKTDNTEIPTIISTTVYFNSSDEITDVIDKISIKDLTTDNNNESTITESNALLKKTDFNTTTDDHDLLQKNVTDTEEIVDDDSPILSGAYEPIQRPPRTRIPQQQNRKFNPFRILG